MPSSINHLAVVLSTIISFALGFVWFTVLFRESYLAALGKTAEQLDQGPSMLAASVMQLIGNLIMAYVLAWFMEQTGSRTVSDGAMLGAIVWVGFVAAVIGPMYAFQAFSLKFFAITTGFTLVSLLVTGAVIGGWRK